MNQDLARIVRLKTMAEAAAQPTDKATPTELVEMAAVYVRLRWQARQLVERAGWSVEEFDAEMPSLDEADVRNAQEMHSRSRMSASAAMNAVALGGRARVLLAQLAAWAQGYQQTFELEAQIEANAAAKMEAAKRGRPGFTP